MYLVAVLHFVKPLPVSFLVVSPEMADSGKIRTGKDSEVELSAKGVAQFLGKADSVQMADYPLPAGFLPVPGAGNSHTLLL